jgi:hypothetical protein
MKLELRRTSWLLLSGNDLLRPPGRQRHGLRQRHVRPGDSNRGGHRHDSAPGGLEGTFASRRMDTDTVRLGTWWAARTK